MNNLAISEQQQEYELQRVVSTAEEDMISYYSDRDQHNINIKRIKDFYYEEVEARKGIPSIEDIMECVYMHNSSCVWRIAEAEYEIDGWHGEVTEDRTEEEILDARDETIGMLCDKWEMYYVDNIYGHIDDYVESILAELELSYYYEDVHDVYHESKVCNEDKIIVANDCQNILFEDFMLEVNNVTLFVLSREVKDVKHYTDRLV